MLLQKIIDAAVDDQQTISVVLRNVLLVGHSLNNETLIKWASDELNGYGEGEKLPQYRVLPAGAIGNFVGPFHSYNNGVPLPSLAMDEEHRWAAEEVHLSSGIAEIDDLSKSPTGARLPWNSNLVLYYQHKFIQGWVLMQAYQPIPTSALAGIVDIVRNKALSLALELKSRIGDNSNVLTPTRTEVVEKTVSNIIYGGTNYISSGQSQMNASTFIENQNNVLAIGNRQQLDAVLRNSGLGDHDLAELTLAIQHDGQSIGTKLKSWVKDNAGKVAVNGVKMGAQVGVTVLTEYLKQHFGLK